MHNATMSNERKPERKIRMVKVKDVLARIVEAMALERASSIGVEVNRAVREMLERENRWPPQPAQR